MSDLSELISLREVAQAHLGLSRFGEDPEGRVAGFLDGLKRRALRGEVTVYGREDCDEITWLITPLSPIWPPDYWKIAQIDEVEFLLMDAVRLGGTMIMDDVDGDTRSVAIGAPDVTPNCYSTITKSARLDQSIAVYRDLHLRRDEAKRFWPAINEELASTPLELPSLEASRLASTRGPDEHPASSESQTETAKAKSGRKSKWTLDQQDAFVRELVRRANLPDGLSHQAKLVHQMGEWCAKTWGESLVPSDTVLKEWLRRWVPN